MFIKAHHETSLDCNYDLSAFVSKVKILLYSFPSLFIRNSYDWELKHDSLRVGQHTALWIKSKETQNCSDIQWSHLRIWSSRCFLTALTQTEQMKSWSSQHLSLTRLLTVLTRYWFQMWKKILVLSCHSYNSVYYRLIQQTKWLKTCHCCSSAGIMSQVCNTYTYWEKELLQN